MIVFAIDALEHTLVEEFKCEKLKQTFYGKTDISEFSEPRTMVLWSSFMTGQNMEADILARGDKEMWNMKLNVEDTFFSSFEHPKIIDLPGFNYQKAQHDLERSLLKKFFDAQTEDEKNDIRKEYNNHAFQHHRRIKHEFNNALKGNHDFVLGYFSVADVIGHLNFGNKVMMKMIYKDLDEIAGTIGDSFIIVSDHGMKKIGMFGDHSGYGYWSTDSIDLGTPKITDFAELIKNMDVK